jgi:hypothetical protein
MTSRRPPLRTRRPGRRRVQRARLLRVFHPGVLHVAPPTRAARRGDVGARLAVVIADWRAAVERLGGGAPGLSLASHLADLDGAAQELAELVIAAFHPAGASTDTRRSTVSKSEEHWTPPFEASRSPHGPDTMPSHRRLVACQHSGLHPKHASGPRCMRDPHRRPLSSVLRVLVT